jgi:hypothetical protein
MRMKDGPTEKVNSKEKYLRRIGFRFGIKVTVYV